MPYAWHEVGRPFAPRAQTPKAVTTQPHSPRPGGIRRNIEAVDRPF